MDEKSFYSHLRCFLMPAKSYYCESNHLALYENAFSLWHTLTRSALLEEKNDTTASSLCGDSFYEYDEFVLITHHEKPIGIFMFRWIDLSVSVNQTLSVIQRFPDALIKQFMAEKQTVMQMGNLAIEPAWRRTRVGFGVADFLMHFATQRFLASKAIALLTTTRNNRSTHTLCYRQGGLKYADNAKIYNVESDIVLFYKNNVKPHPLDYINKIAQRMWALKTNGWNHEPHFLMV